METNKNMEVHPEDEELMARFKQLKFNPSDRKLKCEKTKADLRFVSSKTGKSSEKTKLHAAGRKRCSACTKIKVLDDFYDDNRTTDKKRTADKKSTQCKQCHRENIQNKRKIPENKYKSLLIAEPNTDITLEYFKKLISEVCFYCGGPNSTLGLDRIIAKKNGGRCTKDNVVSCCWICNNMKGTLSSKQFIRRKSKFSRVLISSIP